MSTSNVVQISDRRARRGPQGPQRGPMQTKADVAAHLRVSERTIERWMALGLPFAKPYESGSVRFRASEVDAWFASER